MTDPRKRIDLVSIRLVKEGCLYYRQRRIRSAHDAAQLFREFLGEVDREHFVVLCLDSKNQPTHIETTSIGSLNATIVHPREILKIAILSNSCSVLCCHNHPSGDCNNPIREDLDVTKRLVESGKILGIDLLDHIILGDNGAFLSLKEKGLM